MGINNNILSQADIDSSIAIVERRLVYYALSAAIQDGLGNWDKAECLIKESKWVMLELGVLESNCDDAVKTVIADASSNTTTTAPITVGSSIISSTNSSLPYGEFVVSEFSAADVTEVLTVTI